MTTATVDYTGVIEVLPFFRNDTLDVSIPILQDTEIEGTENFTVHISSPDNIRLEPYGYATVYILDDTRKFYIRCHGVYILHGIYVPCAEPREVFFESETIIAYEGSLVAEFCIERDGPLTTPLTVSVSTADGTANSMLLIKYILDPISY